jgi:acetylornithine deacetylase
MADRLKAGRLTETMRDVTPVIQTQRLRQLLHRLIDTYSPSGKEREILDFLHGYLKRHGLPVLRQPVDDHRYNLVVVPPDTEILIGLMGHLDTIGAYDLDHYGYEERDDLVMGLGASDMKGGCAAMVEGYLALWERGTPRPPACLALVVGEEEDGDGAQRLVKDFHFPWAIVGEPTDLKPCLSHYGYLELQICTTGKRVHASLANRKQNAVESMLHLILQITRYMERDRPEAVYNIRDLFSSQASFAVPNRCEAWLDVHLPPAAPLGEIIVELEELFKEERGKDPDLEAVLRFITIDAGYDLPEKGRLVEALKTVYAKHSLAWEPESFRSHSDANLLWEAGVLPVLLGPGQLAKAHAPDESVSFGQVCLAAELYIDLVKSLSL